jgi:hypothetical protein
MPVPILATRHQPASSRCIRMQEKAVSAFFLTLTCAGRCNSSDTQQPSPVYMAHRASHTLPGPLTALRCQYVDASPSENFPLDICTKHRPAVVSSLPAMHNPTLSVTSAFGRNVAQQRHVVTTTDLPCCFPERSWLGKSAS